MSDIIVKSDVIHTTVLAIGGGGNKVLASIQNQDLRSCVHDEVVNMMAIDTSNDVLGVHYTDNAIPTYIIKDRDGNAIHGAGKDRTVVGKAAEYALPSMFRGNELGDVVIITITTGGGTGAGAGIKALDHALKNKKMPILVVSNTTANDEITAKNVITTLNMITAICEVYGVVVPVFAVDYNEQLAKESADYIKMVNGQMLEAIMNILFVLTEQNGIDRADIKSFFTKAVTTGDIEPQPVTLHFDDVIEDSHHMAVSRLVVNSHNTSHHSNLPVIFAKNGQVNPALLS